MHSSNEVIDFMPMSDRWDFGIPADHSPVDRTGIDLAGQNRRLGPGGIIFNPAVSAVPNRP
jgi:hypothetical protein